MKKEWENIELRLLETFQETETLNHSVNNNNNNKFIINNIYIFAEWAHHQKELFQGITDTRTKLLNSYFVLVLVIALLHFLTYKNI